MTIRRGEIYFIDLDPVQGREQAGRRPAVVISADSVNQLPLVVTVVIGTKGENMTRDHPTNVRLSPTESGLSLQTVFLCFQIRALDHHRFVGPPAGSVSAGVMQRIDAAVRRCLAL